MNQPLRFITAASLFDGHDVSINIMRRILQAKGVEVIHLGHNRSAKEVVDAAIQEDAHAIALSSYQGGHNEYFTYVRELLDKQGAKNIKIFGGGGGVITPTEIAVLHQKNIARIYSPEDGAKMGLDGIVQDMINQSTYSTIANFDFKQIKNTKSIGFKDLAKIITHIENEGEFPVQFEVSKKTPILGITGTGGAGKSSLIDEILIRVKNYFPDSKIALISVDPTKKRSQGALLGDRIRLGSAQYDQFYIRSLATRDSENELSPQIAKVVDFMSHQGFDLVIVETSGIGQASNEITKVADKCLYVMTSEYGAQTQLEKIEMLDYADIVAINKFEKARSEDALRDVRKQYRRNRNLFVGHPGAPKDDELPIFGTRASQFNDPGVNAVFYEIASLFKWNLKQLEDLNCKRFEKHTNPIVPPERSIYLRDIASVCRQYNQETKLNENKLREWEHLEKAVKLVPNLAELKNAEQSHKKAIDNKVFKLVEEFDLISEQYNNGEYIYKVRDKSISTKTKYLSLSGLNVSKVALPHYHSVADKYRFLRSQNIPGSFPFASGIFPFKRADEEPKRMFAGEGGPARTNKRFHYLSKDDKAKRLSTAFDSVTLYGEDPDERLDIFGKIGEAGVSIATVEDMELLYKGFDLTDPYTSVSMTINGPAPIILAFFMNTAIRQKLQGSDLSDEKKRVDIMRMIRGTVQADILKEDQAQNTCIFSLEFALRLMGDVQEFFCRNAIKNYYTVSISGYHIAEAGANPISQVAFTMSNGFTYVEYYLSRGLKIDDFCENLSFFFSNGLDPEYSVIGRVARKIWAIALRDRYGAKEKSQKFKYHIQTSGRSLHAQEISFNDIRTTLQAFLALCDNCNSLHTNAYDEAITTPTEESVRRAMAIQMIINREFGVNKTDNPLQGSFIIEELSELVEEAVLTEFERISDKGGVLGAMEVMYQRSKIQDESLHYETLKDSGELPIIGVNTYLSDNPEMDKKVPLSRSSDDEKWDQINRVRSFQKKNKDQSAIALAKLKDVALSGGNIFEELLNTTNYCSLGQITNLLYDIGGRYRRNI